MMPHYELVRRDKSPVLKTGTKVKKEKVALRRLTKDDLRLLKSLARDNAR
jgi:hypothetical protein